MAQLQTVISTSKKKRNLPDGSISKTKEVVTLYPDKGKKKNGKQKFYSQTTHVKI